MEQLLLDLFSPTPQSFASYVAGANREPVAAVEAFVRAHQEHRPVPTSLYLWGGHGVGKSHLLTAAGVLAEQIGLTVHRLNPALPELPNPGDPTALWLFDDVDDADEKQQGFLFTLYNRLRLPESNKGGLLVAGLTPPARLPLRDDIRTRLGWGEIYEVLRLTDEEKPLALLQFARGRGLPLSEEIIAYLMRYGQRDMRSLVTLIDAVDRYSRIKKRPITLPLVRELLTAGDEK